MLKNRFNLNVCAVRVFPAGFLEKDVCGNPSLTVCKDEPCCSLVDAKHFKVSNIDNKGKVRTKWQLSNQKCSVIAGIF